MNCEKHLVRSLQFFYLPPKEKSSAKLKFVRQNRISRRSEAVPEIFLRHQFCEYVYTRFVYLNLLIRCISRVGIFFIFLTFWECFNCILCHIVKVVKDRCADLLTLKSTIDCALNSTSLTFCGLSAFQLHVQNESQAGSEE